MNSRCLTEPQTEHPTWYDGASRDAITYIGRSHRTSDPARLAPASLPDSRFSKTT